MRKLKLIVFMILAAGLITGLNAGTAKAEPLCLALASPQNTDNYMEQGGATWVIGGTLSVLDDATITWGSTTTTAATKATLEFDETTTGVADFTMGSISVPMVLNTNPGANVVPFELHVTQSAGDGNCTDLYASYIRADIEGDGDVGTTLVAVAPRTYIKDDATADEVYTTQSHAEKVGTGTVTAMSAGSFRLRLGSDGGAAGADDFTATNSLNAGQFIVTAQQSDVDVTSSNFDALWVVAESNVKGLDSLLHLSNGATSTDTVINASTGTCDTFLVIGGSALVESGVSDTATHYIKCKTSTGTVFYIKGYSASE